MKTNNRGFTIVELLIVIVVVGILVSLVMVVYSGSREKASNTNTLNIVNQYAKASVQYATDNGKYPEPSPGGVAWSCMGNGYPADVCLNTISSAACAGIGSITSQAWYNDAVKPYMQNKTPTADLQLIPCNGLTFVGAGYLSNWPAAGYAGLFYMINKNNGQCGSPAGITATRWFATDNNGSGCYIVLPPTS